MRDIIRKKRNWIALAAASSLALTAITASAQDQDEDADQKVEKHESDEGDKKRRVKIIENGKVVKEFKGPGKWEFIGPEIERTIHIERRRAVEDALEEVREALHDVSERLEKLKAGRINARLRQQKKAWKVRLKLLKHKGKTSCTRVLQSIFIRTLNAE